MNEIFADSSDSSSASNSNTKASGVNSDPDPEISDFIPTYSTTQFLQQLVDPLDFRTLRWRAESIKGHE